MAQKDKSEHPTDNESCYSQPTPTIHLGPTWPFPPRVLYAPSKPVLEDDGKLPVSVNSSVGERYRSAKRTVGLSDTEEGAVQQGWNAVKEIKE